MQNLLKHDQLRMPLRGTSLQKAAACCLPEVGEEMVDDRGRYEPANVLRISSRQGLESNANTLPKAIEDRATCRASTVNAGIASGN